ncbi:polyprenyl diphosphate synthase [Mesoaciditoga lauensis]|uniref:polyprenyl diphosphate synthase n=1 Tax=Mesoaciditoga lauensis TaxID=1495039 RepID=UPI0009DF3E86|nr:polyprenyl diphosphate synthase [Mesoaciditoga lauensis]
MIPTHLAIIMDGNGRWATEKGLHRWEGHHKGAQVAENVVRWSSNRKIKYLTLFSFSTENWKRPKEEINAIFSILAEYMKNRTDELIENNVSVKFIGDLEALDENTRKVCLEAERKTSHANGMTLNIALNYGGRAEIMKAAKEWNGIGKFEDHLYTVGQPDPDLLIRTGGEMRISNFMLWQLAYTELYFTKVLWPDFSEEDFDKALSDFSHRKRKFGGIN